MAAIRYKVKIAMELEDETRLEDYSGIEWDSYEDAKEELALAQDSPLLAGYVFYIDTVPELLQFAED